MKKIEILEKIRKLPSPIFTTTELCRAIGEKRENTYTYISRMKRDGLINEVEKGKYTLSKEPLMVATHLTQPSYLSFLPGMSMRGMTDQIPIKMQVISAIQKKPVNFQNTKIQFIKFKRERIFGYEKVRLGRYEIFVGTPEKLIVDSLYMPKHVPVSETFKAMTSTSLDEKQMLAYGKRMESGVTTKRLGYLLDCLGSDYSGELEISAKIEPLNPVKPAKGAVSRKWNLLINEVLDDA
jgi:predicted transcriptional regulator of viral defense system